MLRWEPALQVSSQHTIAVWAILAGAPKPWTQRERDSPCPVLLPGCLHRPQCTHCTSNRILHVWSCTWASLYWAPFSPPDGVCQVSELRKSYSSHHRWGQRLNPPGYSHSSLIGLTECLAPVRWLDLPWHPIGHWMLKFVEIMACNALYFFKLWTGWTMQLNLQPWFSLVRLCTWVKGRGKKSQKQISEQNSSPGSQVF